MFIVFFLIRPPVIRPPNLHRFTFCMGIICLLKVISFPQDLEGGAHSARTSCILINIGACPAAPAASLLHHKFRISQGSRDEMSRIFTKFSGELFYHKKLFLAKKFFFNLKK